MTTLPSCNHRFALHGLICDLRCEVPLLNRAIDFMVGEFAVDDWPDGFTPTTGLIRPYDADTVMRHLSPGAKPIGDADNLHGLYEEGPRFWLVDDRWGLVELNLVKNHFHAWVLPDTVQDMHRVVQDAIIWPLAQLLRGRGIHLVPAASVTRNGWGMLIVSQCNIEAELRALVHAGFRVIGQQWTALREEDGKVAMLHLPGMLEHLPPPQLKSTGRIEQHAQWIDLNLELPGSTQHHAFCDTVMIVEQGRRAVASVRPVNRSSTITMLRDHWPIVELHPQHRPSMIAGRLASQCRVFGATLSRRPDDLLKQLDTMRYGRTLQDAKVQVQVNPQLRRQIPA